MQAVLFLLIFILCLIPAGQVNAQEKSKPRLKWSGDLRLRTQSEKNDTNDRRTIQRLRLRLGMQAELQEDLRAEIRLATALGHRSANQTLGDKDNPGAPRRPIGLDLAYARWQALKFLRLDLGRIPQSQFKAGGSEILLDDDIALEGAAVRLEQGLSPSWNLFGTAGSALIRENYDSFYSEELTDNVLNFAQMGLKFERDENEFVVGAGFFNYTALQGMKFSDLASGASARGNSESPAGVVKNNYVPRQVFAEFDKNWGSWNSGLAIEHLVNSETKDPNKAWWISASVGQKVWDSTLAWGFVESDAVPAIFTQSSFGDGRTDVSGIVLSGRYKLAQGISLKLTQMVCRLNESTTGTEYLRTHLDLSASF
jgi:hypothetical protein